MGGNLMKASEVKVKAATHPLEPLTAEEITKAVAILKETKNLTESVRFAQVVLNEPEKDVVLSFQEGDLFEREVFIILLEPEINETYEAVVSLTKEQVNSFENIPDVRPGFILDEFEAVEELVRNDADYQAALMKRGITDPSLVMIDPWSSGYFNIPEDEGKRLVRALAWVRPAEGENGYAFPITGLIPVVDVNKMEIIRIEDYGVKPISPTDGAYTPEEAKSYAINTRQDVKALDIIQPDGPSFDIDGHHIKWQKWNIRFGFTPREGLVLHTVGYEDKGKVRPILFRAA